MCQVFSLRECLVLFLLAEIEQTCFVLTNAQIFSQSTFKVLKSIVTVQQGGSGGELKGS
jgi:hypothetical protein